MKKLGLVLGSGGGRGFSHVGVLKVLQENNIKPDYVIGSSIGALVGGLFCKFGDYKEVEKILLDFNWKEFSSLLGFNIKKGLLKGEKLKKELNLFLENSNFEDLQIPLEIVSTCFRTAEPIYFGEGKVSEAIQASIAFPMLSEPLKKNGEFFWDGGFSDPLPVKRAKEKADFVVAVNLEKYPECSERYEKVGFYRTARRAVRSLQHHLSFYCSQEADVLLEPKLDREEGFLSISNFLKKDKGKDIIEKGVIATEEKIELIKKYYVD